MCEAGSEPPDHAVGVLPFCHGLEEPKGHSGTSSVLGVQEQDNRPGVVMKAFMRAVALSRWRVNRSASSGRNLVTPGVEPSWSKELAR